MSLTVRAVRAAVSNFRAMAAISLALSVALPPVVYQTSLWRKEAAWYAAELERGAALKAISGQASEHMGKWLEARKRMPLAEPTAQADAAGSTAHMQVHIENQRMSRADADRVLEGLAQNTEGQFVLDAFLVRAMKAGEGIYAKNTSEDVPGSLTLTVKGEFASKDFR